MEQEQYEEDVKVVILPDRQEVTVEDLGSMPDVVRERVRYFVCILVTDTLLICLGSGLSQWQYAFLQYWN